MLYVLAAHGPIRTDVEPIADALARILTTVRPNGPTDVWALQVQAVQLLVPLSDDHVRRVITLSDERDKGTAKVVGSGWTLVDRLLELVEHQAALTAVPYGRARPLCRDPPGYPAWRALTVGGHRGAGTRGRTLRRF